MRASIALLLAILSATPVSGQSEETRSGQEERNFGSFLKWSRIEIAFEGPASQGRGHPNPFAISFDVEFAGPDGNRYRIPGFYDGDGKGGLNGNVWKVRFAADQTGSWTLKTLSDHEILDGHTGHITVAPLHAQIKGFWNWGRLEYIGTPENEIRYLKFRDGPFWLKAGCDDPENFLGNYSNFDTISKRKAAVDYLADHGINSLYIMTHNIDGDDRDVWPWLGESSEAAKANGAGDVRFDIAKLETWRDLFEHMQTRGVVPYLILEDDSAWSGYNRELYHREIIARFGYLPALIINLGEEHNENYRLKDGLKMAAAWKALDPYNHPLAIHNINRATDEYIESPDLDFTAIQTGQPGRPSAVRYAVEHNQIAVDWINRCRSLGRRVLVVNFDEGRPEYDRRAWWSAYMGGGVWEAHVTAPYDRPYSAWEKTWGELGGARAFMESLPFYRMHPNNDLVKSGNAFCLAKPGEAYALYLPEGDRITVRLASSSKYETAWWNPSNARAGTFESQATVLGGDQEFVAPSNGDWALRIFRVAQIE